MSAAQSVSTETLFCRRYESIDRGRVWAAINRGPTIANADGRRPVLAQEVGDHGYSICTECPSREACDAAREGGDEAPCGCQGDGFGLGTQSCAPHYDGILCSTCSRGYYPGKRPKP